MHQLLLSEGEHLGNNNNDNNNDNNNINNENMFAPLIWKQD